eukprot:987573-Alexandrium_andersonii.AAC.1
MAVVHRRLRRTGPSGLLQRLLLHQWADFLPSPDDSHHPMPHVHHPATILGWGARRRRWAPGKPGCLESGSRAGPAVRGAGPLDGCLAGAQPEAAEAGAPTGGGGRLGEPKGAVSPLGAGAGVPAGCR